MDYQIIRFLNGRPTGDSETWMGHPLDPVKDHARQIVETGLAERVEVRDTDNTLMFQWPRTLKASPGKSS